MRTTRPKRIPRAAVAAGLLALSMLASTPARAQDEGPDLDENDQIVLTGRLVVEAGRTVDAAAILHGPATIEGTVRDSVFVLNGDTEISGTVRGDVIVVNGSVTVRSTAEIDGDLLTSGSLLVEDGATIRGSRGAVMTRFDVDLVGFAGRFAWWLGYTVSVLVLGLVLLAFAPRLETTVRDAIGTRLGSSIGWGVGLFFLLPVSSIVLLFTIVGIPLGLSLLAALALIYTLGYTVATIGAGTRVLRAPRSRYVVFLAGWAILRALALIPVVGGLLWLVASVWGLGLLAVSIRAARKPGGLTPGGLTPEVPPPPPVPLVG